MAKHQIVLEVSDEALTNMVNIIGGYGMKIDDPVEFFKSVLQKDLDTTTCWYPTLDMTLQSYSDIK